MSAESNAETDLITLDIVTQRFLESERKIVAGSTTEEDLIELDNAYQAYVTARTDDTKPSKPKFIQLLLKELGS